MDPNKDEETGKPEELDINIDGEGEIAIDIVEDIPEKDRFAKPLDREVADPTDEEIEGYGAKVQARIKELTHARHDERRKAETLAREKAELEHMAQTLLQEREQYKQIITQGSQTHAATLKAKAEADLEAARRKYKEAAESYDADAMLAAQEELTEAKWQVEAAKNFRPPTVQTEKEGVQIQPSAPAAPVLDERTQRWMAKNQWFGNPGYEELTAFALGLHQKLVVTGVDPRTDAYFERVDSRLRQVFPEVFQSEEKPSKDAPDKRPANVVASATRTPGAKKKVTLTATAARLADKFGISHEQYAREFLKLEAQNG